MPPLSSAMSMSSLEHLVRPDARIVEVRDMKGESEWYTHIPDATVRHPPARHRKARKETCAACPACVHSVLCACSPTPGPPSRASQVLTGRPSGVGFNGVRTGSRAARLHERV